MDGDLPVGKYGGYGNQGQRHGQRTSGGRGAAKLICVTDPLCDLHLRTNQVGHRG